MRLPSFLQRKNKAEPAAASPASGQGEAVLAARTRARRRLIGAVVLLAAGVVGFPLLFETQPRPVPVDIPIEVARKDAPTAPAPLPRPLPPAAVPKPEPRLPDPVVITERPGEAGTEVPPPAAAASAASSAPKPERAASTPTRVAASAAAPRSASAAAPAAADDGARAQALLNGTVPASAAASRFVVQAGAYTDAATLHEARQKVEKLGLKTYTQVIETEAGKRTRVRIGPFANRQEAEAAAARIKAAGLPAALLAL